MGSNCLKQWLVKYPQYHFICVDKMNYASSPLPRFANLTVIQFDLSADYSHVEQLLSGLSITDIINFAAESSVDRSFVDPVYFTRNNILCAQNVLEFYRLNRGISRFVHVSTDEVYGDQQFDANEDSKLLPTNPYSATKASIDLIIGAYIQSYGLKISIVRPNNLYGPGQYPEKIIPMSFHCLRSGLKIPLHGDGSTLRCYLHVIDFARALDCVWHNTDVGVYNVGTDVETSTLDVAKMVIATVLKTADYSQHVEFVPDRMYNDKRYSCDLTSIRLLGWAPTIDLHEGIAMLTES